MNCNHCGAVHAGGQKFCGNCGATLLPEAVAVDVHDGRRHVAVLFTDLTGFTELSTAMDAEDLHALVQAYFDQVESIVSGLGGSTERYIGDAIMAVFGARKAHDDDALRAVRAGLDIQAAMPELSRRFARVLTSVVGIASGEVAVMAPRPGYAASAAVVGMSVNLAARIESLGGAGDVLVSDDVYRQLRHRVRAETLGPQVFKGVDSPVEVWRVTALATLAASALPRMVDRDHERGHFAAHIERCLRDKVGATIVLRGEPGIGKSRLLAALGELAESRGLSMHRGTFLDFGLRRGNEGLHALTCSLLGIDTSAGPDLRQQAADAAVARGDASSDALPLLYELAACPQTAQTRGLFDALGLAQREQALRDALSMLVRARARERALLIATEDLHWADTVDIQRLAHLAKSCSQSPVLMALTIRATPSDPVSAAWQGAGLDHSLTCLDIAALEDNDMRELAGDYQGIVADIAADCMARSGGNPLFFEQLLRHVSESGGSNVPGSISSLVQARMDTLPAADRTALQAASVLGQRFELDALRQLLGNPAADCKLLIDVHLVRRLGEDHLFSHALIHEAVYATLLRRTTRELHLKAAAWYASRDPALQARHLDRGGDTGAPAAYLACAGQDTDAGRYDSARTHLARGLELATEPADRVALLLQRGQLQHDTGEVKESIASYRSSLELASTDADRARAWTGLAAGMRLSDDMDGAFDALAQAERCAREPAFHAVLARIHYLRGSLHFPRGEINDCRREHALALDHARQAALPRAEADALSGLGDACYASGRMRTAHQSFLACMDLCRRNGFGRVEAANLFMVATVRIYMVEHQGALNDALAAADLARRLGHQRAEIVSRLTAGWVLITLGQLDRAQQEVDTGMAVTEALGAARFRPFLMESAARIALLRGDRPLALETTTRALSLAREGNLMRFIGPWVLGTLAKCAADAVSRAAALSEGAALLEKGCVGHNYYRFYAHAIDASADAGDSAEIERWTAALQSYTSAEPNPWANFHIARGEALAAWLHARTDERARRVLAQVRTAAEAGLFLDELPRLDAALAD